MQSLSARLATRSMCAAMLLLTAGCSPLRAINAFESEPVASDVGYAPGRSVTLDVFAPEASADDPAGPRSVIVFFFGGAWHDGSKEDFRFVGSQLAKRGFVVVLPDYRLHPQVRFPAFVEDAADAVAWTFEHAAEHGGDPSRVFLMGHSAGAHIAALLHYDQRYLERAGASRAACGFVGLAGPYDFLPLVSPMLKDIFPAAVRDDSQPVNFVDGSEGPALLVHGLQDDTVKPRNSASLAEAVQQAGGDAELRIFEDRGHVGLLLSLSQPLRFLAPTLDAVTEFANRQQCADAAGLQSGAR